MKHRICLLTGILLCSFIDSKAQADSTKTSTRFKFGTYYITRLHYYGRTDSLQSSAFFPTAEVCFGKHFYVNAAPVFISNRVEHFKYAGTIATVGYQFNDPGKWSGHFYVVKPFYQRNSQLVQSALKGQIAMSMTKQDRIVNLTGGADIKISEKIDLGLAAGIDHIFRIPAGDGMIIVIDPTISVQAGTQQFTRSYQKKSGLFLFPLQEEQIAGQVTKLSILNCEMSVPVVLAKGKWLLLAIPVYTLPQNLIEVPGRPDLSEYGKSMFTITLGAKLSL